MGNLSCVSCKVKDKSSEKAISNLPQVDHKPTALNSDAIQIECIESAPEANKEGVRFVESLNVPQPNYHRTTAQELYDTLKSQRLKDDEDNNLDDVEKAAKAIVDMTVFLTTQVIYPAYLTYLREDHPDVFKLYFGEQNNAKMLENNKTVDAEDR